MCRYIRTVFVILSLAVAAAAMPADEISDTLTRAESLYYEAKFKDAIQLLEHADDMLRSRTDRRTDKINVKLQLALAHVGLNEAALAKVSLRELYTLDPEYRLDPQQIPPKVIALADEAKSEQNEARCQSILSDARKYLESGNAAAVLNLTQSMKSKCAGLDAMEPGLADLFYKTGVEAYKAGQFSDALEKFRSALKLAPKHELAAQYFDLTQSKLQVNGDRQLLEWRKTLDAHDFRQAAVRYEQMKDSKDAPPSQMLDQMRTEYRNALAALVNLWNRSCASGDAATMESIPPQMPEHLPEPSLGDDLLAQMKPCVKKGCMTVTTQLVLARLKVQVNPVLTPAMQDIARRSPTTVHVKTRIDEKGDVTVLDAQGSVAMLNEVVRGAVAHWKFTPVMDENGPRCAEADIPVIIKQ
jgi:tetratricopeptide (TPR) repeat protein